MEEICGTEKVGTVLVLLPSEANLFRNSKQSQVAKRPEELGHSKVNMTFLVSGLLAHEFSL